MENIDPRWYPYLVRFPNVPESFFDMKFPETLEECQDLLDSLRIDEESVLNQISAREAEAKYIKDPEEEKHHVSWLKAAQKVKQIKGTQISIVEALQRDMCETYGVKYQHNSNLHKELRSLKLQMNQIIKLQEFILEKVVRLAEN